MMLADKSYPCYSYKVPTPDGKMIVNFIEEQTGDLIDIQILMGKTGYALAAWVNGVSALIRLLIETGVDINDILLALSNITTNRFIYTDSKAKIRSGIDGLAYAIMQYSKQKYNQIKEDDERPIFRNLNALYE